MFGATLYKMYKLLKEGGTELIMNNMSSLIVGNIVAFIVAMIAIKGFIKYVQKYGFKIFGWYRILVGGAILIMILAGFDLTII
jgi:undecaprenyl-diphosphatase